MTVPSMRLGSGRRQRRPSRAGKRASDISASRGQRQVRLLQTAADRVQAEIQNAIVESSAR